MKFLKMNMEIKLKILLLLLDLKVTNTQIIQIMINIMNLLKEHKIILTNKIHTSTLKKKIDNEKMIIEKMFQDN